MKYDDPAQIIVPFGVKKIIEQQAEKKGMDIKAYLMSVCTIEQYTEEEIENRIAFYNGMADNSSAPPDKPRPYLTRENICEYENIYHKGLTKERAKRLERDVKMHMVRQYLKTIGAIAGVLLLLALIVFLLWAKVKTLMQ